jgi:hypothetical protein
MITPKYIRQDRKFARRESQAASAAQSAAHINETIEISNRSACGIDFIESPDRLPAGYEESSKAFEINRKADKVSASRTSSIGRIDRFEESLYWFLSAATLIYLLFEIVSF